MKTNITCQAKKCQEKILIKVKKNKNNELETQNILNFCEKHNIKFNTKLNEIKNYYSKKELQEKLIKNITNNLKEKNNP